MADGNNFFVDTDGLDRTSPEFQNIAGRIRNIGSGLQSRLEALGECWGDDHTGHQFLNQYLRPKSALIVGIKDSGEVLDSTVDGISTMAKNYKRQEEENIRLAQNIRADQEESLEPQRSEGLRPQTPGLPVNGGGSAGIEPHRSEALTPQTPGIPANSGEPTGIEPHKSEALTPQTPGIPANSSEPTGIEPHKSEALTPQTPGIPANSSNTEGGTGVTGGGGMHTTPVEPRTFQPLEPHIGTPLVAEGAGVTTLAPDHVQSPRTTDDMGQ